MYGLCVTPACAIHDVGYRYDTEASEENKRHHDDVLLNNLIRIIEAKTKCGLLKQLRLRRAKTYYFAVTMFGGPAYWGSRNYSDEMQEVTVL